jgi:uncharacterized protein
MVPVGNAMVYLRPLYVASTTNPLPQLTYVIGVVGQEVVIDSSLSKTLSDVLKQSVTTSSGAGSGSGSGNTSTTTTGTLPAQVQQDLAAAQTDYTNAQAALKAGGASALGTYQSDITAMEQQISNAEAALKSSKAAKGTVSTSTTTTTAPKTSGKKAKTTATSTEPKSSSTTTTTLATAAGKS